MCKDSSGVRGFFAALRDQLTTKFNVDLQQYNSLRPHIERLTMQNGIYRGPVVEGASSMILHRVNGVRALYNSPQAFYNAGINGYKWAYYFTRSNNLNTDMRDAGMAALNSHLSPLSLSGIARFTVTGFDVLRGGGRELAGLTQLRYEQQRNALFASATLGMAVTQIFKTVGTVVQTDMQRMLARTAMRSWQVTGCLGICYGLSNIHQTMGETGIFGSRLMSARDAFVSGTPSSAQQEFAKILQNSDSEITSGT